MMIADTSIWIEFLKGVGDYPSILGPMIEEHRVFTVECVFGELLQGVRSNKEADIVLEYWKNLPKVQEEGIWLSAGKLSSEGRLHSKGVGLIDLAILSAARKNKLKVWTLDKNLKKILSSNECFEP
ncbi:PIN domain-containing protein [Bdellovibrionota bacterium FG-1]